MYEYFIFKIIFHLLKICITHIYLFKINFILNRIIFKSFKIFMLSGDGARVFASQTRQLFRVASSIYSVNRDCVTVFGRAPILIRLS